MKIIVFLLARYKYLHYICSVRNKQFKILEIMTTTETNIKNQIINTMIQQLGGNRFFAMTGAKPKYKDLKGDPSVMMQLKRSQSKAKFLQITYNQGADLYTMLFFKMTKQYDRIEVAKFEGVYGDMMQPLFTKETGMYTSL